jgi:hypothetical protein
MARLVLRAGPGTFLVMSGRAHAGPNRVDRVPAHLTRAKFSGLVSSSSPGHAYSATCNYSYLQKSIRWGSRSIDQWRQGLGWHAVGGNVGT